MNCPACTWEMNAHASLPIVWCANPHCGGFDRPQQINREARVAPEKPDSLPACLASQSRNEL